MNAAKEAGLAHQPRLAGFRARRTKRGRGGALTLENCSISTTITLQGQFTTSAFATSSDGHGGVIVTLHPVSIMCRSMMSPIAATGDPRAAARSLNAAPVEHLLEFLGEEGHLAAAAERRANHARRFHHSGAMLQAFACDEYLDPPSGQRVKTRCVASVAETVSVTR